MSLLTYNEYFNGSLVSIKDRDAFTNESFFNQSTSISGGNSIATERFASTTSAVERCTVNIPSFVCAFTEKVICLWMQTTIYLNSASSWDNPTYATASNRNGKDFYIYLTTVAGSVAPRMILSANSTCPIGLTASNSRNIGGFHCLCVSVGAISGHTLSGYLTGDILPRSVWDINHHSSSTQEGFTFSPSGVWVAIYLPSVSGGELVSVNGGTIADGSSATAFNAYKFDQWFGRIGQNPIKSLEFVVASLGANQGTNIFGSADPVTTGGHTDTAGRRMISNIGCEDMCGVLSQWGSEQGAIAGSASWVNAFDANDSGVAGQHYNAPSRPLFGGIWNYFSICGSRSSNWSNDALLANAAYSSRGVAEPAVLR